jgi:hypothetical protein
MSRKICVQILRLWLPLRSASVSRCYYPRKRSSGTGATGRNGSGTSARSGDGSAATNAGTAGKVAGATASATGVAVSGTAVSGTRRSDRVAARTTPRSFAVDTPDCTWHRSFSSGPPQPPQPSRPYRRSCRSAAADRGPPHERRRINGGCAKAISMRCAVGDNVRGRSRTVPGFAGRKRGEGNGAANHKLRHHGRGPLLSCSHQRC